MAIDFTLTPDQQVLQESARDFAENVLRPVVREADEEPDPLRGFNLTKPAYREAVRRGIAFSMLPKEYGGGGLSNVDFVIAAEEICAVDPGFATRCNNDHGVSPDGTRLAISDQSQGERKSLIYTLPIAGGTPKLSSTLLANRP